jgi:hypothetical protein
MQAIATAQQLLAELVAFPWRVVASWCDCCSQSRYNPPHTNTVSTMRISVGYLEEMRAGVAPLFKSLERANLSLPETLPYSAE